MPSVEALLVTSLLRLTWRKRTNESPEALRRAAEGIDRVSFLPADLPTLVSVEGDGTRSGATVKIVAHDAGPTTILYIHGGGWVYPARKEHWRFLTWFASETHSTIYTPLYPRAPTYCYRDVMALMLPFYRDLIESSAGGLVVMGDSAGANIALSMLLTAHQEGVPMPRRLVLISPLVDATFSNPESESIEPDDPMLTLAEGRAAAQWYAGDLPIEDPRISPMRGPLAHLPKTQLFIGTVDLLLPDARLFRDKAMQEGVDLDYHEAPGMIHDWPLIPFIPEARAARKAMAAFIRTDA